MSEAIHLSVDHLRALRVRLVDRRWRDAYEAADNRLDDTSLDSLITTHQAIAALDAVIAEGRDAPADLPDDGESQP